MATTPHLGLPLTGTTAEEKKKKFQAWRQEIAGLDDTSALNIIDAAIAERDQRMDAIDQADEAQNSRIDAIEDANDTQDGRIADIFAANQRQDEQIEAIKQIDDEQNELIRNLESASDLQAAEILEIKEDILKGSLSAGREHPITIAASDWNAGAANSPYTYTIEREDVTDHTLCILVFSKSEIEKFITGVEWETTTGKIAIFTENKPSETVSGTIVLFEAASTHVEG